MKKLFILLILASSAAWAQGEGPNPMFEAVCRDINTHGYRGGTNVHGEEMQGAWTTAEKFGSSWRFKFTPPDQILIDGRRGYILTQTSGVIIAMEAPGNNGSAAGVWTYAIQIGLQKVVGSQVNASGSLDSARRSVKARSTNFDCRFQLD